MHVNLLGNPVMLTLGRAKQPRTRNLLRLLRRRRQTRKEQKMHKANRKARKVVPRKQAKLRKAKKLFD